MKYKGKVLLAISLAILVGFSFSACGFDSSSVKGPVYLVKAHKHMAMDGYNFVSTTDENERDEQGNPTRTTRNQLSVLTDGSYNEYIYTDYDKYGYYSKIINNTTGKTTTIQNTVSKNGLLEKSVADNEKTIEIKYYSDGKTKKVKNTFNNNDTEEYEYDNNGYLISYKQDGTNKTTAKYTWDFDDKGYPKKVTVTINKTGQSITTYLTFKCDEYGNITSVYDENKQLTDLFEYQKVDNPSVAAWIESFKKQFQ